MRLTKLQRFTAYCIMLEEVADYPVFFCNVFHQLTGIDFSCNNRLFKQTLPELWDKRPKRNYIGNVWYPSYGRGHSKRIEILKQCIEETHP